MNFPKRPTCHDDNYQAKRFGSVIWCNPYREILWRTCSYCGSIHPEDLIKEIKRGAKLSGADWKYGWPHKLYLSTPNPEPNTDYIISSANFKPEAGGEYFKEEIEGSTRWVQYGKQLSLHGKWYNEHITDEMDEEARQLLVKVIKEEAGIEFSIREKGLYYKAPYFDYQKY